MATGNDENVFASPWNDSDMVLVVEEQELHVHRSILTLLSLVFKAMLDGHFKEASEDKITLEGKDLKLMILFLIKQCINEAEITPGNVLEILPYVVKYHQKALPRMYEVINWSAPTSKLEVLSTLENKQTLVKLLFTKCRFLESSIVEMQDAMFSLTLDCLREKRKAENAYQSMQTLQTNNPKMSFSCYSTYYPSGLLDHSVENQLQKTAGDSRCAHVIQHREINKVTGCPHCKEKYKKCFGPIYSFRNRTQHYFDMFSERKRHSHALQPKSRSINNEY